MTRTGPIGRLARALMALFFLWALSTIADQGGPASFRDSSNLREPIMWALQVGMLAVFVLLAGQLAAATAGPAAVRRWQVRALTGLAAVLAAGALTAWLDSGGVWASPFTDLVWTFDAVMLVETIVALVLAIALGTPGCEVGVWPELIARLRGEPAPSTKPICVLGLHFVDEWEARRARARSEARARASHRLDTEETLPSVGQQNLETVAIDFLGALRRGDFEAASTLLDPDITWQGLREGFVCRGRAEVVDAFRWGLDEHRETDALEFVRGSDRVVMGVRGPTLTEVAGEALEGQIFNVFTLRRGRITRIDDYRRRSEALSAAGIAADAGWG